MFMAWIGLMFIELLLELTTLQITVILAIAIGIGLILKDVNGILMLLAIPIITGLVGLLAKLLISGWLIFALFGYLLYIVMDGVVVYLIVYWIKASMRSKKY